LQLYGSVLRGISPFLTADMILPVPLHESKLASRGYNQAACFGRGLADAMGIPMYENVLMRVKATASQTRKNREQRWDNVGEVFGVRIKKRVEGKHIILVDDVVTTGATIEACAAPLLGVPGTTISIVSLAAARQ
jgi:ComF family protein